MDCRSGRVTTRGMISGAVVRARMAAVRSSAPVRVCPVFLDPDRLSSPEAKGDREVRAVSRGERRTFEALMLVLALGDRLGLLRGVPDPPSSQAVASEVSEPKSSLFAGLSGPCNRA
ncbi:hypothetical protein GSI_00990 [Ganoderma sinense ZZ0214-1]|uniref:Uncharacterized protein n=1 Tax=Ganoderma sinense ZZ0214-1 TaxID=1077348 RepID=A0A2G8SU51_9APHY|nr:hypothetical protein GSI_00990 [Ganoderma sinense ZZ0214-1]